MIKRLRNRHHGKRKSYRQIAAIMDTKPEFPPPQSDRWQPTTIRNIINRKTWARMTKIVVRRLGLDTNSFLTIDQAVKLFNAARSDLHHKDSRRRRSVRIVLLLLLTGLRRQELCRLKIKYLPCHHGKRSLTVWGKGNTLASIRITPYVVTLLDPLADCRKSGALMVNRDGKPLKADNVYDAVRGAGRRVGMPFLRPHILRHTYASILLWAGCDIAFVRNQLRHANLSTTNIYVDVITEKLSGDTTPEIEELLKAINPQHPSNTVFL